MTMYRSKEEITTEIEEMSTEELMHEAASMIAAARIARQNGVGYNDRATSYATEAAALSNLAIGKVPENAGFVNQDQQALRDMVAQELPAEAAALTPDAAPYPRGEGDGWS